MLRIQHKMYTTPRASPTLAASDTHAREPRQSALSTCLPLRPSNYQSEGLRCPAARSVSWVQRATAERESSSLLHACNGTKFKFNKTSYFLHTEVHWFIEPAVHYPSTSHQISSKYYYNIFTMFLVWFKIYFWIFREMFLKYF